MISDRPDRVPDGIEPLVGYRAWLFDGAALVPFFRHDPGAETAWEGAHRHWVSATCRLYHPGIRRDSLMRRLERVYQKVGHRSEPAALRDPVPHAIPDEGCSCGFYAMKTLGSIPALAVPGVILGRVELAGKVIDGAFGYRAERARIAALIPIEGDERSTKRLAFRLGLPLTEPIPPIRPWNAPDTPLPPAA
jgi:hypothetical protein